MSDLSKTVAIIFSGVDNLSSPINTISKKLDSFSSNISAMGAPLDAAAMSILKIDAALVALAGGGLAYAFNESMKFENAAIELKKVLGDSSGVDIAIAEATRLSEIYGESADSILLSAANFKQAGYDIEDALTLTADSMDLVIAGNIDAAQSSGLIIAALKGFGEEADQAGRFVDILNEVSNNYATDVEQLAIGMSKLSPIAKIMGFSMEETAGLLVPVIEIFRSGDEAAIALRTGLLKLIDDSKPVAEGLAAIGVAQFDSNGAFRSGEDIYRDVAIAFQTMDQNQKLFITQQLVGIQQAAKMVVAFDNLTLSQDVTAKSMNATGSAAKEVAVRLKSAEVSVKLFKVSFDNLAVTIGDQFRLAAQEAIDGGTDIEQALRDIIKSGTFDSVFKALNDFAGDIGVFLSQIAENLPEALEGVDFSGLLEALGSVGESIKGLFDNFDLSTPEGLEKAIQEVIDTLESLASTSTGIFESLAIISDSIIILAKAFNELNPDTKELVGNILGLGTAMVTLGGVVGVSGILLKGIGAFGGMLGSGSLLATGITGIVALLSGPVGLAVALGVASAAIIGFSTKSMNAEHEATMKAMDATSKATMNLYEQISNLSSDVNTVEIYAAVDRGEFDLAQSMIDEITKEGQESNIKAEVEDQEFVDYWDKLANLPDEKSTEILALINAGKMDEVQKAFEDIEKDKKTDVKVEANSPSIIKAKADIAEIPNTKMLEIQLQGDMDIALAQLEGDIAIELAEIEAMAGNIQTAFEWTAKLDIAQIEADAEMVAAAFDAAASSVGSTAEAAADMFSSLVGNWGDIKWSSDRKALMGMVQQQIDLEREALSIQRDLTEAQIEYMQAKSDALKDGDGLIKIESDGLEPALEMIMWQILEKVQLRVTEEAGEFLLGLGATS